MVQNSICSGQLNFLFVKVCCFIVTFYKFIFRIQSFTTTYVLLRNIFGAKGNYICILLLCETKGYIPMTLDYKCAADLESDNLTDNNFIFDQLEKSLWVIERENFLVRYKCCKNSFTQG